MPVPTSMNDLSATESSNSPAGSDAISTSLDNYLRAIQAIVRTTNHKGADIASAASVAIGAATGEFVTVTGTTTITSFDSVTAGIVRTVLFSGALTLTHSTNIQMPGAVDYTTTAGDVLMFRSLGSGQWKCVALTRSADPNPLPALVRKQKAATTSRNSTTVTTADPDLANHTITATKKYKFKLYLIIAGPAGGFKCELRDVADGAIEYFSSVISFYDPALTTISGTHLGYSTAFSALPATSSDNAVVIEGHIEGHASSNRTLDLFWAQDSSSASPTFLREGSYFELQEI